MKKSISKIVISSFGTLLIFVIIFLFLVGNKDEYQWKGEISVGLIAPLTGSNKSGGISMKNGVELAIENINNNGGINGYRLKLIIRNDKGIPLVTEEVAKELIYIEGVKALIGPFSSDCCLAIKGLINSSQTPLINPVAMSDVIISDNDYIFRNTLGVTDAQLKVNSYSSFIDNEYLLLDGLGAKTLGILWQNDIWGEEMQQMVINDLEHIGKKDALLYSEPFTLGLKDYSKTFSTLDYKIPDIIYIISSGKESTQLVKTAKDLGFTGLFMGEGGFNSYNFDKKLKNAADGCFFSTQWHPSFSTPMSDVFLKTYSSEYDGMPDMFAAISYEAVYILKGSFLRTIYQIRRDDYKVLLRNDLATHRIMDGITGKIYFDSNGQCDRPMFIMRKKWDGSKIQSLIIYPTEYSQSNIEWNFDLHQ